MQTAQAFYDWGRWVADCPECTDAVAVYGPNGERGQTYRCANGHEFTIELPSKEKQIEAALADRDEADRSWYPQGHARAKAAGLPVGESVTDLKERTGEIVREQAEAEADRSRLREALEAAGVEVAADGTFGGKL